MSQVRQSQPRQATAAPANRSHQPADPAAKNTSEVLPGTIEVQRKAVIDLWNNTKNGSVKERVAKRWNEWSPAVRANFIKRAQNAVIAQIQTSLPRKQWAQWEVTIKFCLDLVFTDARNGCQKHFNEAGGLFELIRPVLDGKERDYKAKEFEANIDKMMSSIDSGKVANFDRDDKQHRETLRNIRALYWINWSAYVMNKLSASE